MKQRTVLLRYGIMLRPVEIEDAAFIIRERRSPRARLFLGETQDCLETQQKWIRAQQQRDGDHYFICQADDGPCVGTIGVYNMAQGEAEWGRFLINPGYNAALQALSLLFDLCFDELQLHQVRCTVVAKNEKARKLYEWVGHKQDGRVVSPAQIAGLPQEQVSYALSLADWRVCRTKVLDVASRIKLLRDNVSDLP